MQCTGPCNQGRAQCPTPDACELFADEPKREPLTKSEAVLLVLIYVGSLSVVLYLAALARGWLN